MLVGPSGCGKSTTLRMVAGLEEISAGTIAIGERVVNHLPPKDRDIAMVFQNYALYQHMSVYDNLAFGLRNRKVPEARIREEIERAVQILGIGELLDRKPRQLSGRPAAAGRARPLHRAPPAGVPVRRAALQPRRQAARADAGRAQAPARARRHDLDLRHPRPGRGDDARRSGGGDARRPRAAGRHAARDLFGAGVALRRRLHRLARDELHRGRARGPGRRARGARRGPAPRGAGEPARGARRLRRAPDDARRAAGAHRCC